MLHKLYTVQWILLIVGIIFLAISIYTLFRGIKKDKIVAISVFLFCLIFYVLGEIRIKTGNEKAEIYFGVHQLNNYNNSSEYKLEVLPDKKYRIYDNSDTVAYGNWELSVSEDNSTMLLLDGRIFGIGELDVK